ncbi:hypothetical protein TNCV_1093061, partial [Trichonephila clavipes]
MVSISRSPERSRFTDFGSPPIPMSVLWIAKGDIFDMVLFGSEINKNRVCAERVSMLRVGGGEFLLIIRRPVWQGLPQIQQPVVASGEPPLCNAGPHPGTTWSYKTGGIIHQLIEQPGHA